MGTDSAIGWTDHTFNPWHGCTKVSPACDHCYAETFSKRTGRTKWGDDAERWRPSEAYWLHPLKWNAAAEKAGEPALVFCASMADVFEDRRDLDDDRTRLFELIAQTPHLRWLLLTKRPEHVLELVPPTWRETWPSNAWVGTTVEDQENADERIPHLLEIPAPVRFLSLEPLLGPVTIPTRALIPEANVCSRGASPSSPEAITALHAVLRAAGRHLGWRGIDWLIVGGESGPGHRPLEVEHARALRDQAKRYAIPLFFKQHGGQFPTSGGDVLDGYQWKEFPGDVAGRSRVILVEQEVELK